MRGQLPAKKNLYKAGRGRVYLPAEVKAQLAAIAAQLHAQWRGREAVQHPDITVRMTVHSRRGDRDNMVQALLDCMTRAGVIANDNIANLNGWLRIAPAEIHDGEPEQDVTRVEMVLAA